MPTKQQPQTVTGDQNAGPIAEHTRARLLNRVKRQPPSLGSSFYYLEEGTEVGIVRTAGPFAICYTGQADAKRIPCEDLFEVRIADLTLIQPPAPDGIFPPYARALAAEIREMREPNRSRIAAAMATKYGFHPKLWADECGIGGSAAPAPKVEKRKVYWLTSDIENDGTSTELFESEADFDCCRAEIVRTRCREVAGWAEDRRQATAIRALELLDQQQTEEAWELFTNGARDDGADAPKRDDDCFWWGSEVLAFPAEIVRPEGTPPTPHDLIANLAAASRALHLAKLEVTKAFGRVFDFATLADFDQEEHPEPARVLSAIGGKAEL